METEDELAAIKARIEAQHAAQKQAIEAAHKRYTCILCKKELTEEVMKCSQHGTVSCYGCLVNGLILSPDAKYPVFSKCSGNFYTKRNLPDPCVWHKLTLVL